MPREIERRFLALPSVLPWCTQGSEIEQGYLRADGRITVRVRVADGGAVMTVKGPRHGCARVEFESEVPMDRALALLNRVPDHMRVRKTRYRIERSGLIWEVDVFSGPNAGLIIAEVEIDDPLQPISIPEWVAFEVTSESRYSNSHLARNPFALWANAA
ncbi:MAG: CYTH domain-containing protein [Rhodospirillaceae bacterium]